MIDPLQGSSLIKNDEGEGGGYFWDFALTLTSHSSRLLHGEKGLGQLFYTDVCYTRILP